MARETKAQRQERLAVEEALRIEVDTKDYPSRLMHVFELACEIGYRIKEEIDG